MRPSSRIALALCLLLTLALGFAYRLSRATPEALPEQAALQMLRSMQDAVQRKSVGGVMAYIAPDAGTRIANLNQDQLRLLLARAFRGSGNLRAETKNVRFTGGDQDAVLDFDLAVFNTGDGSVGGDYTGHVTLHLSRVETPHLLGLYHTREWRIVSADSTGRDMTGIGE